jgi:hypothetical protein
MNSSSTRTQRKTYKTSVSYLCSLPLRICQKQKTCIIIKETRCTFRLRNYGTNLDRLWQWQIYSKKCWPLKLNLLHPLPRKGTENPINNSLTTANLYRHAMAHSQNGLFRLWCSLWRCRLLWAQRCFVREYCPVPMKGAVRKGVGLRPLDSWDLGSNPAGGMYVRFCVCCVLFCNRSEEF